MRIGLHIAIALAGALLGFAAGAAEPIRVTLDEALERARAGNPMLQAARAEVDSQEGRAKEARGLRLPDLTLSESFQRTNNPVYVFMGKLTQTSFTMADFALDALNDPEPFNNYNTRLEFTAPLFTGGKIRAANRAAVLGVQAAEERSRQAEVETVRGVTESFFGSLLAQRAVVVMEEAVKTALAHRDQVKALHEEGMALDSDWLRIQVYVADLEQRLATREADARTARAWLAYAMGEEGEAEPVGEMDPSGRELPELETVLERALVRRGDLRAADLEAQQALQGVKAARGAYWPEVGLMASYDWNTEAWQNYGENWAVGVQVRLPLFDGGGRSGRLLTASARERQAASAREDLRLRVRVEAQDAWFRARAALKRSAVTADAAAQARENLRIVELRYQEGLAAITDLLDADTALLTAELTRAAALHDERVAFARLDRAMGGAS